MMAASPLVAADVLLIVQTIASSAMCGIIWFVQAVHYPLFARIRDAGREFAIENQRRTQGVVIPFMLAEAVTAGLIAVKPPMGVPRPIAVVGLIAVAILWLSTVFAQMPLHARLAREGHAPAVVEALVRSNWLRTGLWSLRAALAAWMLRIAA